MNMKTSGIVEAAVKGPPEMLDDSGDHPLPGAVSKDRRAQFNSVSSDFLLLCLIVKDDLDRLFVCDDKPFAIRMVPCNLGPNISFNGDSIWVEGVQAVLNDFEDSGVL